MKEIKRVIQVMPAEHWWKVYKQRDKDVCYYMKVFFFVLADVEHGDDLWQMSYAIDYEDEFSFLNSDDEVQSYLCLHYDPELQDHLCFSCNTLSIHCECEDRKIDNRIRLEKLLIKEHKESIERIEKYRELKEKEKNISNNKVT